MLQLDVGLAWKWLIAMLSHYHFRYSLYVIYNDCRPIAYVVNIIYWPRATTNTVSDWILTAANTNDWHIYTSTDGNPFARTNGLRDIDVDVIRRAWSSGQPIFVFPTRSLHYCPITNKNSSLQPPCSARCGRVTVTFTTGIIPYHVTARPPRLGCNIARLAPDIVLGHNCEMWESERSLGLLLMGELWR